jgi:hypothetical protein
MQYRTGSRDLFRRLTQAPVHSSLSTDYLPEATEYFRPHRRVEGGKSWDVPIFRAQNLHDSGHELAAFADKEIETRSEIKILIRYPLGLLNLFLPTSIPLKPKSTCRGQPEPGRLPKL